MDNDKLITGFWTLCAIIIGWLLSQVSNWIKSRQSENRARKRILFCMLEIHHTIPRLNIAPHTIINKVIDKLFSLIPISDLETIEAEKKEARLKYANVIMHPLRELQVKRLTSVNEKYEETVLQLSSICPLLAYELTGITVIHEYSAIMVDQFNRLTIDNNTPSDEKIGDELKDLVSKTIRDDALRLFREKTLQVAYQIGIVTWIRTKRYLKISSLETNDTDETQLNEFVDKMVSIIRQHALYDAA